jgi:hypothetical protein
MIGQVLQFPDLQELCSPGQRPRRATVEAWARGMGLRFAYDARGGMWTTIDALNAALGLGAANDPGETFKPEQIL